MVINLLFVEVEVPRYHLNSNIRQQNELGPEAEQACKKEQQ